MLAVTSSTSAPAAHLTNSNFSVDMRVISLEGVGNRLFFTGYSAQANNTLNFTIVGNQIHKFGQSATSRGKYMSSFRNNSGAQIAFASESFAGAGSEGKLTAFYAPNETNASDVQKLGIISLPGNAKAISCVGYTDGSNLRLFIGTEEGKIYTKSWDWNTSTLLGGWTELAAPPSWRAKKPTYWLP